MPRSVRVSAGAWSIIVSAADMFVVLDSGCGIGLPHCRQNHARSRTVTPQATQRRAISGSDIETLNPMHRVEEIFSLRVDANAELLAFQSESILQLGSGFARARCLDNDDHGEFSLHHSLIDVNDTATGFRQNL